MDCLVIKLSIIVANVVQFGFSKSKCIKPFTIVSGTLEIYFLFICFGVFLKIDLVSFFMCLVVFLVFKIWIFFMRFSRREFNEFRPLYYCERCLAGRVSISILLGSYFYDLWISIELNYGVLYLCHWKLIASLSILHTSLYH